jgi:hypothetical protein
MRIPMRARLARMIWPVQRRIWRRWEPAQEGTGEGAGKAAVAHPGSTATSG